MHEQDATPMRDGVSRRAFMTGSVSAAAAPMLLSQSGQSAAVQPAPAITDRANVSLTVNGQPYKIALDVRTTLLDALRDHIGLTGTKKGCDHGQCGACTVLVDDKRVLSCLSFAVMHADAKVTTIEGLAAGTGNLHPLQRAFVDHDAFQCGYCTPGQIMSAVGCIREGHAETDDDIREYMSGNLCRCAAYPNIVAAIRQARTETGKA